MRRMKSVTVVTDGNHFDEQENEDEVEKKSEGTKAHLRVEYDFDQSSNVEFLFVLGRVFVCVFVRFIASIIVGNRSRIGSRRRRCRHRRRRRRQYANQQKMDQDEDSRLPAYFRS